MPPAWPESEYLQRIGELVYAVASIEGLLIFDLPQLPDAPPGASPAALAGRTTTVVGDRLAELAVEITDDQWCTYLLRGAEALRDIGPRRNAVLHARPATIDGQQRLYRWRTATGEVHPISMEHLDDLLQVIDSHASALNGLRPTRLG